MEWTTIITALVSTITATGGIGGLFHLRETKRAKRLENDRTAASEWKELYERMEVKNESLSTKIEGLYKKNQELRERLNTSETARAVSEVLECKKHGCFERDPPFGSNTKKH